MSTVKEKINEAGNRTRIKRLIKDNLNPDTIGTKKGGNILCRWGYFYTHGATAEDYAMKIRRLLTNNKIPYRIVDCGNHWAAFRGGASVANQSHFYVEVHV